MRAKARCKKKGTPTVGIKRLYSTCSISPIIPEYYYSVYYYLMLDAMPYLDKWNMPYPVII